MAENYFHSSLTAEQIEGKLVGAVVFNADLDLTDSEKARARLNIGAGQVDVGIIIKGYFASFEDLEAYVPIGNEGDAYGVGTNMNYNVYVWDAVHGVWVNNGAIIVDDIINDNDIAADSTWSSRKLDDELGEKQDVLTFDTSPTDGSSNPVTSGGVYSALSGKQDSIEEDGILKGTESGVQAAVKGVDYGALSFVITLASASWTSNVQTVSDSRFLASGYVFFVSPDGGSRNDYCKAQIYSENVSTDGEMVFHCKSAPSSDLLVNVSRVVSA